MTAPRRAHARARPGPRATIAAGALLLFTPLLCGAQARSEVSLDLSVQALSGARSAWQQQTLHGATRLDDARTVTGTLMRTRRFGLVDVQAGFGAYWRPSPAWTLSGGLLASDTARVLPRWDGHAQVLRQLGGGWNAGLGWRRKLYQASDGLGAATAQGVNTAELLVEAYWGQSRAAWIGGLSRLDGGGRAAAQRVQWDYFYRDDGSRLSLTVAFGQEIERLGPQTLLRSQIRTVTLFGVHWLEGRWRDWAVNWELTTHRQGEAYRRTGGQLGLRWRF